MRAGLHLAVIIGSMTFAASAFAGGRRGATRVDFDDALIKGQTNRGAVHLIERKDSDLGSLVKSRRHFRKEILTPYGYKAEAGMKRDKATEAVTKKAKKKKVRSISRAATTKRNGKRARR